MEDSRMANHTDMESLRISMVNQNIKATFEMEYRMAAARIQTWTKLPTRETGKRDDDTEEACKRGPMVPSIMERGKRTRCTGTTVIATTLTRGQTETFTLETFNTMSYKDMAF
jgi:hypothetical protein